MVSLLLQTRFGPDNLVGQKGIKPHIHNYYEIGFCFHNLCGIGVSGHLTPHLLLSFRFPSHLFSTHFLGVYDFCGDAKLEFEGLERKGTHK